MKLHLPEVPLPDLPKAFDEKDVAPITKRGAWKVMLPLTLLMLSMIFLGWHFKWDVEVVAAGVLLFGAVSQVFAWVIGIVALVPIVGPIVVKVLSLSIIWLLNAIGYLVAYIAIKRGYSKDVLTYRGLTIALIIGIIIGYLIGHFF